MIIHAKCQADACLTWETNLKVHLQVVAGGHHVVVVDHLNESLSKFPGVHLEDILPIFLRDMPNALH